jgi:hypothetical protein
MQDKFAPLFGALIALILLLLYAVPVLLLTQRVWQCGSVGCGKIPLSAGVVNVVTTIGGLVSVLVISKLAITAPGQNPAGFQMTAGTGIWW